MADCVAADAELGAVRAGKAVYREGVHGGAPKANIGVPFGVLQVL